ncbi:hypothetical protein [Streptomyces marianii]|uniref:Uncharacterized protein n=1 Tax=Streptomyces marianii TaxID=1817406 RepID=A0A5R9DWJ6_9ACTN|nr:hypothetical protein [Streptomyces marianii]TLQ39453.1 hypothetical protein FEF34_39485 [Streptomyces marianii]
MAHDPDQDRRTAGGFLAGAGMCVMLAAATHRAAFVLLAAGMLVSSLMFFRRVLLPRPFYYWPAWATGAAVALLLAWAFPGATRLVLVPLAAAEAVVALVLAFLWRRRRYGRGDWIAWLPMERILLRREWTRREVIRWAEDDYREPCAIGRADDFPDIAAKTPLYPDRERPLYRARPLDGQA